MTMSVVACCLAWAMLTGLGVPLARADVIGGSLGTPFVYGCTGQEPPSGGDTWYNTWADDGNIYATSDDSSGFNVTCQGGWTQGRCPGGASNLVVNEVDGADPEHLSSSFTNCMTSYGLAGSEGDQTDCPDHDTWKTGGVISVNGTLYVVVSRQSDIGNQYPAGYQATEDASIIKSTDHGRTWTSSWTSTPDSTGAAPSCNAVTGHFNAMFPGSRFANIFFINYGQDDAASSATEGNGGDSYVYAMANDGFAYDGGSEILGRVLKSDMSSLNPREWQFYENNGFASGSGDDSRNWTSNMNQATVLISAPRQLSQASVQYVPGLQQYVLTSFYYPFDQCWPFTSHSQNPNCNGADETRTTNLSFYQSPTPWGPWTNFYNQSNGFGWYDPTLVSKFVSVDGLSETLFTSGDFGCIFTGGCPAADLLSLHAVPFAMTSDISGSASTHGYWLVGTDGGIFSFGSAQFYGSAGSLVLQRPVVGIVRADVGGYWLDASDGGVFSFGDTQFYGSLPGLGLHPAGSGLPNSLNAPIVGMVPSNDYGGYFMVASDGGVFAFGDAHFAGSCPGIGGCSGAAVAVMPDASGKGYWLVTQTGNVYTFGDAHYHGAPGNIGSPVTSAVRTPNGGGYWILTANGAVYGYGDAANLGSPSSANFNGPDPAAAIFATSDGAGYWVSSAAGKVFNFGDAPSDGDMSGTHLNGAIIAGTGF